MESRWSSDEAASYEGLLGECVYASRLLGGDPSLVLHGGGNTSAKTGGRDVFGHELELLWVKASGSDLAEVDAAGFVALDLAHLRRLADMEQLSDGAMANELQRARLDSSAPSPSVETLMHAVIPDAFVQHTHADALLAVSNTVGGPDAVRKLFGRLVVVVPYVRSGFALSKATAECLARDRTAETIGIVLLNHGLVTFGDTARLAYERMVELVTIAEENIAAAAEAPRTDVAASASAADRLGISALRAAVSAAAGAPMIVSRHTDELSWSFGHRLDLAELVEHGPATPDHVIWTKRTPMLGRDVEAYAQQYQRYFEEHRGRVPGATMLDPAPRVVFDAELGMLSCGPNVAAANRARDLYRSTIKVIEAATGSYAALPASEYFDVEYWALEQSKLAHAPLVGAFAGEVAIVTGAASGIGRACALELLRLGAAVVGLDINTTVADVSSERSYLGLQCDITGHDDLAHALDCAVDRFGGVDIVVAAAGVFAASLPIAQHDPAAWRRSMSVNVDALVDLLSLVHPLLAVAFRGGRLAVIGSKNIAAPGPGASAYSSSKAAANQLARVAALEWAHDGIRVNSVHPDAVFDTGLWTDELLADRAARYGMTTDEYKRRNLLGVSIESADVARVVVATLGPDFRCVTGSHIPIDGGNERVI